MTTFSGSFSTTDKDATIRPKKDPVGEVIDILDQIGQDDFTAQAMSRPQPQRPAPVNVGMMPERRGDITIPMQPSTFGNDYLKTQNIFQSRPGEEQVQTPLKVVSPFTTVKPLPGGEGTRELLQSYDRQGISSLGNIPNVANISSGYPMKPDPGYEAALQKATPSGLGGIFQGILGSLTGSHPAVYMQTDEYGDPMGGGNYAVGRTFENPDTARRLGFIPVGRDAGGNIVYDVDPAITKSQEDQERSSRLDDERRERAAMLAAQQQQPVDPCPEGYRMDPVSKVCVPVDDTIDTDPVKRTYDTLTRPEPNYTAATGATLPVITLPDILG